MHSTLSKSLLVATLLAAPLVVMALGQGPGGRGRGGPPMGSPLIDALDIDRDGTLSNGELDAAPAALRRLDRDGDGRIARAELMPMGRGREGRGGRGGPGGPEGGRGRADEPGETPATSPGDLSAMLMGFDENKDGTLAKSELPERLQPIFDRADANKDGKLTSAEIEQSAAAAPQPNRGGGREGFGREGGPPVDRVFMALDLNHDDVLEAEEMTSAPASLRTLDANKDAQLTPDEYRPMGGRGR